MTMINPEQTQELLADYVLGEVTPAQAEAVQQMLLDQPELQAEINSLQETLALLALSLPDSSPPADLKERILQLAETKTIPVSPQIVPIWRSEKFIAQLNLKTLAIGAVALSIIGVLGFSNYRLQQRIAVLENQNNLAKIIDQSSGYNHLVNLHGTDNAPQANGAVVVMPKNEQVTMMLYNLPPLSEEQIYHLWAIRNGEKIDCGQFRPDAQGRVIKELPLEDVMMTSTQLLVTIESSQPSFGGTGTTVMVGQI
ncbi:anti-sigma factor [Synechocystis salina]|uniref:anti-sigma factor n=1 Tax=Synechocystis salina TaxID=945780 RepID=UPI001D14D372|nr:anti-sigma factor [Synechocystis salina]